MKRATAAVVMPTFNGARWVTDALESVTRSIEQAEPFGRGRVEIVVVDDASDDDTVETVRAFGRRATAPVTVVEHDRNRGTGAARNTGVGAVDAGCYLFLDQDDQYLPGHVGTCLEAISTPGVDFVRTDVLLDRPVHPQWQSAIANSLSQTLCVTMFAHRLVGGFIDDPAVKTLGSDDVLYGRLLRRYLRAAHTDRATVRYRYRAGNAFDRQWQRKFSQPPERAEETLTGPRLEAAPAVVAAYERRLLEVDRRVQRLRGIAGSPGAIP